MAESVIFMMYNFNVISLIVFMKNNRLRNHTLEVRCAGNVADCKNKLCVKTQNSSQEMIVNEE